MIARQLLRAFFGLLVLAGAYVGLFSLFAGSKPYPVTGVRGTEGMVRGAYHVHSTASDGEGEVRELAHAARRAGLRFVVLTDHNVERLPEPVFVEGVLVIHQVEESTPYGHVVALGAPRGLNEEERKTDPIEAIRRLGGTAVLAHPVQPRNPWRDWDGGTLANGLELYSGDSMLREVLRQPNRLACSAGSYLANPPHGLMVLVQPAHEARERLLSLTPRQGVPIALCAHDAHGTPPYETVFKAMSLHLALRTLPEDAEQASRVVLDSLARGDFLCAFDALGDASAFALAGLEGRTMRVGASVRALLPPAGDVQTRVAVYGAAKLGADGRTITFDRVGTAQIEVQLLAPGCILGDEWRPWIVINPIRVEGP
ncbi:MAG: PHP domain-containing protein [Myxococcota bacterium]